MPQRPEPSHGSRGHQAAGGDAAGGGFVALLLRVKPLYWLLVAAPIALAVEWTEAPGSVRFLVSGLAIIPLAGLMGRATENLAHTMGPGIGGLLNATFGNAAELIIALMLLAKGPAMYPLVKASVAGSIMGNILLVLGLAMLLGGLRFKRQEFNATAAGLGATLLALATVGLLIPTIYYHLFVHGPPVAGAAAGGDELRTVELLSDEIAAILAIVYVLSLVFSLDTHRHLFAGAGHEQGHGEPEWGRRTSLLVLIGATIGVAVMSEILVGAVEEAAEALGMNSVFVGVIVVAVIGNAAEHSTAVLVAMKNQMDLAFNIAVGSGIQIALFVAPVLVFASLLMGHDPPMDLHFSPLETVAVVLSIWVLSMVSQDGQCHWMEGVMLLALYVILALAFYHLPGPAPVLEA